MPRNHNTQPNLSPSPRAKPSEAFKAKARKVIPLRLGIQPPNAPEEVDPNVPGIGVRPIPKNPFSLTGRFSCVKNQPSQAFESTLERDAMVLLDSDPGVRHFRGQPLAIYYHHQMEGGKTRIRRYTPDLLISFVPDPVTGIAPRPWLVEVKPRGMLIKHWAIFRERFHEAHRYAAKRGWVFRILTEQELQPKVYLANLKWLRPNLRIQANPSWGIAFLDGMAKLRQASVQALLEMVCPEEDRRPEALPTLWHLVATRQIWTDLSQELTLLSTLKIADGNNVTFEWGPGGPPLRTRRVVPPVHQTIIEVPSVPRISLKSGAQVSVRGYVGTILRVPNAKEALVRFDQTGVREAVPIKDLEPFIAQAAWQPILPSLMAVDEDDLKAAIRRAQALRPLIGHQTTRKEMERVAADLGVKAGTVYRWFAAFEGSGWLTSSLLPTKPNGGRGKARLKGKDDHALLDKPWERVEAVIQDVIENFYLKSTKRSPTATANEVRNRCKEVGLPMPSLNTVRRRIDWIAPETKLRRRHGNKVAKQVYRMVQGSNFPPYPLAVVQVDHTKLDVCLVDPENRQEVGRAWITLMFDVYSRMVVGFHVGYEAPGNGPFGACIRKAALGKETWLAKYGVDAEWPCWGFWETLHADNAKEFRGNMVQLLGDDYGFTIEWRPLKKPEYGGHIERMMGTLATELHSLDGTTFSSIAQRGDYQPSKYAYLTIDELERWLAHHIIGHYHNQPHSGLDGDTPLERYLQGICGTEGAPGRGLPDRVVDSKRLRQDVLPYEERKIQADGIQWDGIQYFSDVVTSLVDEKDPADRTKKREFLVRRDPADISIIYLLDPKTNNYLEFPYLNTGNPRGLSLADWKATKHAAKKGSSVQGNEERRMNAYLEKRKIEKAAKEKSKVARRNEERRRRNEEQDVHGHQAKGMLAETPRMTTMQPVVKAFDDGSDLVQAFAEIE